MKNRKIMIADDDPAILDALEMLLVDEGYEVATASDGETVKKVQDDTPDLLLLDIWMSGEDGREIAKILKKHEKTKDLPIVMISASKDIDKSARESGADDFLAKPFDIEDLLKVVSKYVNQ